MKTKPISLVANFPNAHEAKMDSRGASSSQFGSRRSDVTREPRRVLKNHVACARQSKRSQETATANGSTVPEKRRRKVLFKTTLEGEGRIRVAVVDDDHDMRQLMRAFVERTGACICVGIFADAETALAGIPEVVPDVVLMDIQMPGLNGIECTRRLKQIASGIKVIMVTGQHGVNIMNESLRAGADGYLLKPVTIDQCLATIKFAVGDKKAADLLLSKRERQVMQCLVQGLLYKEISGNLGLSYSAVRKHQHRIFLKLSVTNRSEAIEKWHKLGAA